MAHLLKMALIVMILVIGASALSPSTRGCPYIKQNACFVQDPQNCSSDLDCPAGSRCCVSTSCGGRDCTVIYAPGRWEDQIENKEMSTLGLITFDWKRWIINNAAFCQRLNSCTNRNGFCIWNHYYINIIIFLYIV